MIKIAIVNGPNLNLLGKREPEIYGNKGFEGFFAEMVGAYPNAKLGYFQSNIEGELIDKIQKTGFEVDVILLNAGGYTHTSVAIADAIAAVPAKVIEVHISNPLAREEYRHASLIGQKCHGTISGFGLNSYKLAIEAALALS